MTVRRSSALLFGLPCAAIVCALLGDAGCRKQGEGDRCDVLNRNADCDSGLECVAANLLLSDDADRCCPPEGEVSAERACRRRVTLGGGTPSTGEAGAGGTPTGAAGGAAAGAPSAGGAAGATPTEGDSGTSGLDCAYPSDCPLGQTCGPRGLCQPECQADRDCAPGEQCTANGVCVVPGGAGGAAGAAPGGAGGG
jgi:hypothetical protein